jgi:hypothetical protein
MFMDNPYVGILLNVESADFDPHHRKDYENISFYIEAGRNYSVTPCFMHMKDVDLAHKKMQAYIYSETSERYVKKWLPLPSIVHNRALYAEDSHNILLDQWSAEGMYVFNRRNRYGKLNIHEILLGDPTLAAGLPDTCVFSLSNLAEMMKRYDSLILKPNRGSIGRGIIKLDRQIRGWRLVYPKHWYNMDSEWLEIIVKDALPSSILHFLSLQPFLIQQRLALVLAEGCPFDLRVSVQRDESGDWGVTGLFARVAGKNHFITNVARGGTACTLEQVLHITEPSLDPELVRRNVTNFALRIVRQIGKHLPHMADVGIDIGIDGEGGPMFIDCNGKDQRYGFKEADMAEVWKQTYFNPIGYAKHMLNMIQ